MVMHAAILRLIMLTIIPLDIEILRVGFIETISMTIKRQHIIWSNKKEKLHFLYCASMAPTYNPTDQQSPPSENANSRSYVPYQYPAVNK